MTRYVIIGNGIAGTTAAANIRKLDSDGSITILTDEPYPFYSRIRLIEFLSGEVDDKEKLLRKEAWYDEKNIRLLRDTPATAINPIQQEVVTSSGLIVTYNRLLLAAGGSCFAPPLPGADKRGVFTLRTLADAIAIKNYAKRSTGRVLLLGGGILGLEAGNSLRKLGNRITVVEFFPRLLPRQMDPEGAEMLKRQMEKMGFVFYLDAKAREIAGADRAEALILDDGTSIDCDMILISAGIRPNTGLGQKTGLEINRGIVVNDRMETSLRDIYAAGDLTEHKQICYGIWPAAEKQGEVAGINMAGGSATYQGTTISNTLKVAGIDLVAVGNIDADMKEDSVVVKDPDHFIYKKLVIEGKAITGAILFGDIGDRKKILRAIEEKRDISGIRDALAGWDLEAL
ncbi:MAG: NAD(P)/FAD-dependent oxidoreductase [Nitrospirae bacterium]|nr:NAD(P)/FAD-dependent oxidoreductase [Nitrospirota bacterium]